MTWKRYALARTVASACWLLLVVMVVFAIYRVLAPFPSQLVPPGTPAERRQPVLDHASSDLGDFLGQLARGSLGESFTQRQSVNDLVASALPVTLSVVAGAIVLALALGVPLGFLWAGHRLRGVRILGAVALSLLPLWLAFELAYYVAYRWDLSPTSGYCDLVSPPAQAQCGGAVDWARQLQLPWLVLAVPLAALYARAVRRLLQDVQAAPAGDAARRRRAAGVAMTRHVTRDLGVLLGTAVFVEAVFGLPGLGAWLHYIALDTPDYPVAEGVLLAAAGFAVLAHLTVDLVLAAVAPEARAP